MTEREKTFMQNVASVLFLFGLAALGVAAFWIHPVAGLVFVGCVSLLFSFAIYRSCERDKRDGVRKGGGSEENT